MAQAYARLRISTNVSAPGTFLNDEISSVHFVTFESCGGKSVSDAGTEQPGNSSITSFNDWRSVVGELGETQTLDSEVILAGSGCQQLAPFVEVILQVMPGYIVPSMLYSQRQSDVEY